MEIKGNRKWSTGDQSQQEVADPNSDEQPGRTTKNPQKHAFGQQLPDQARPTRPQGQAHGNFFPPRRAACRQKISYVRASDQQNQPNHCH